MGKRQADYTISDVIRLRPTWLEKKQTDPQAYFALRDKLAGMLDYGMQDVAHYPFRDVFSQYDISQMTIQDVNRVLGQYKQAKQSALAKNKAFNKSLIIKDALTKYTGRTKLDKELNIVPDFALKQDTSALKSEINSKKINIKAAEDHIEDCHREIARYTEKIQSRQQEIARYHEIIEALEAKLATASLIDKDRMRLIEEIPSYFRLAFANEKYFGIVNVEPCILTETNAEAGVNRHLNMGHYLIQFDWSMNFKGIRHFANCIHTGAYHPHVNSYICWGNLQG